MRRNLNMGSHRASQSSETEELRRLNQGRERVLARLWEIADLDAEMTRNSMSAQIKALSMIVAIEGLIPDRSTDRRAGSWEKKSASLPAVPQIDTAAWLREQQAKTGPDPLRDKDGLGVSDPPPGEAANASAYPGPTAGPDFDFDSSESVFARPSETTPSAPHVPVSATAPGTRVPSSIEKKPDTWRLRL
jgi:hypothetical protein